MASPVLHIKDAYYFEVPKFLRASSLESKQDFPDFWVRLDADFQLWEAQRLHGQLESIADPPAWPELQETYLSWKHDHANFGKPLDVMLEGQYYHTKQGYDELIKSLPEGESAPTFSGYLEELHAPNIWFAVKMLDAPFRDTWTVAKQQAGDVKAYKQSGTEWSQAKLAGYNNSLSGKILIPQPFGGELKNLYEPESGFCVSKFLIIQLFVAFLMLAVFSWLGKKARSGGAPKGRLWNFLEVFLVFVRESIAKPAIGAHDGDRFTPLLWTIFMFVLGCNLCGMLPWVGVPTGSFAVTSGLALVIFGTGMIGGMRRFGPLGFFANQVPHMELPLILGIFIKPMLFVIELMGLCIKHAVLAVRLLANMVAGHLVLLGIMGLAFGASAAATFAGAPEWQWWLTASISVVASTMFSCLELFVAFLQAYIFTFLSALFIGAAIHHH